jgi:uncharacterized protein (PEP-CTERM system associated)
VLSADLPEKMPAARTLIRLRPLRCLALSALALGISAAWGQGRGLILTPALSVTQVLTDNRGLDESNRKAEAITIFSPSVRLTARGARSTAFVNYSINGVLYARESGANNIQNALQAGGNAVLVDEHVFIQAQASISQQAISALRGFGEPQFGSGTTATGGGVSPSIDPNRTEVRTLTVAPTVRGRLFGETAVEAGLRSTVSSSSNDRGSDRTSHQINLSLGDSTRTLGWSLYGSRFIDDFQGGRQTTRDQAGLRLFYNPWPNLSLFASGGIERNDVTTVAAEQSDTWGAGLNWQPTPRTRVGLQGNRQFFGNSWSANVSHRLRRSVFSYIDTRSVTASPATILTVSAYDLFFLQFASVEPDPVLRDLLVREFLLSAGLNPNQLVNSGFLTRSLSLQHSRTLAMSLSGRRTNFVVSAFDTNTRRLDRVSAGFDDFSNVSRLRQYGGTASVSQRLTPASSAVLTGGGQRTRTPTGFGNGEITFVSLSWVGSVGPRTGLSLSARHAIATGSNPYDVTTLSGTVNFRF